MTDTPQVKTADPATEPGGGAIRILRWATCACFMGWAWQHLRWGGAPYDAVLWNPDYFAWAVKILGVSWETYVAEVMTDSRIRLGVRLLGLVYLGMALMSLRAERGRWLSLGCLVLGSLGLALVAFCKFINAGQVAAIFVEQGGQILVPCVLLLALLRGARDRWTVGLAIAAFGTTFIGHGIYAIGWAPTPGHFYGMTHAIFGLGERGADLFLKTVGALDFLACFGLLWPRIRQFALGYAVIWGLLTSLARPLAGMSLALPWWGADQFLHEAVYRAPHFALPLFLFLVLRSGPVDMRHLFFDRKSPTQKL